MKYWGLEPTYDAGRMIAIYEAIKELPITSMIDVACGTGIIADGLQWMMPNIAVEQFDIESYPEWQHLRVKPWQQDVLEFCKQEKQYDLVLFLNSYRNWDADTRGIFDSWLKRNARYFIHSGEGEGTHIGLDVKGHTLKLYENPHYGQ